MEEQQQAPTAPDGRDELADQLAATLKIPDAKMLILGVMADYEIRKKETGLILYDGGQTEYLIQRFLVSKKVAGRTDRTCKVYGQNLRRFFAKAGKSPTQCDHTDVQAFIADLIIRGCGKSYQQQNVRTLSSFYSWMTKEDLIEKNIMLKVEPIKNRRKKKDAFTDMDVEKIRAACRNNRQKAMIEVLLSTGCRVFEAAKLLRSDCESNEITIIGKGDKQRKIYLNAKAQLAIASYLAERKDNNPYLFPASIQFGASAASEKGCHIKNALWYKNPSLVSENGHIGSEVIESMTRTIGKRAGVKNCHPHRFRRTCATMALRRGMSLVHVQQLLGHESLETTRLYLDITEEELMEAHRKYVV